MEKITGLERPQDVPNKVMLLYEAVAGMIAEGGDVNNISVSAITKKAGIGKGTAYEYFESKEDILISAIVFYIQKIYGQIRSKLASCDGFPQQMTMLLDELEKGSDKECSVVRYVHLMTDSSGIGRMVVQKMQKEPLCEYLPAAVLASLLKRGVERGEIREDLPMEYMVFILFTKLMSYFMCIRAEGPMRMKPEQVRPYLYESILSELCKKNK